MGGGREGGGRGKAVQADISSTAVALADGRSGVSGRGTFHALGWALRGRGKGKEEGAPRVLVHSKNSPRNFLPKMRRVGVRGSMVRAGASPGVDAALDGGQISFAIFRHRLLVSPTPIPFSGQPPSDSHRPHLPPHFRSFSARRPAADPSSLPAAAGCILRRPATNVLSPLSSQFILLSHPPWPRGRKQLGRFARLPVAPPCGALSRASIHCGAGTPPGGARGGLHPPSEMRHDEHSAHKIILSPDSPDSRITGTPPQTGIPMGTSSVPLAECLRPPPHLGPFPHGAHGGHIDLHHTSWKMRQRQR